MAMEPGTNDDSADRDAEAQVDAMNAQLRKDVASWSKARHEGSMRLAEAPGVPIARPALSRPVARAKPARPAAPSPKPASTQGKPFRMSYSGSSIADYVKYRIDRGGR